MFWGLKRYFAALLSQGKVIGVFALLLCVPSLSQSEDRDTHRLLSILNTLNQLKVGQILLSRAVKMWKVENLNQLSETMLRWGRVSRTDTVLTRHFDPRTGKETREREITIFLKRDQSETEALLDLVHELVHSTVRPDFDPYDPTLTPIKYVKAAIEGAGGEVEAVAAECKAALEMSQKYHVPQGRCLSYLRYSAPAKEKDEDALRNEIKRDFYKVGKWYSPLVKKLGPAAESFSELSFESPRFYSSTGRAPYPVALYREFEELTQSACENSRNRLKSLAHFSTAPPSQEDFLIKRCR